eukprot:TRINITY_DN3266_c0_g1_i3.p3 TRINITY_DN3266_c0_g1~~TRINITY_DN3266_c0_g1_i3.p3  ORF type:complete len:146 (-),score=3.86 TRINITY_DN3266_c0_g1_i3:956-1393(-)
MMILKTNCRVDFGCVSSESKQLNPCPWAYIHQPNLNCRCIFAVIYNSDLNTPNISSTKIEQSQLNSVYSAGIVAQANLNAIDRFGTHIDQARHLKEIRRRRCDVYSRRKLHPTEMRTSHIGYSGNLNALGISDCEISDTRKHYSF